MLAGARPAVPGRDLGDHVGHEVERVVERRPVLEVDALADLLGDLGGSPSPAGRRRPPRSSTRARAARAAAGTAATCRSAGGRCRPGRGRRTTPTPRRRASCGRPAASTRPQRESSTTSRTRADVAGVAPPVALRVAGRPASANSSSTVPASPSAAVSAAYSGIGRALVDREVAGVLVDPVRAEPADDPVVPPRQRGHLARATRREVFQSSRMSWSSKIIMLGHGREQPAVRRVAPGELVDLAYSSKSASSAPGGSSRPRLRLDEVAASRPTARRRTPGRRGTAPRPATRPPAALASRWPNARSVSMPVGLVVLLVVRHRCAARAEDQPQAAARVERPDPARREVELRVRPAPGRRRGGPRTACCCPARGR